MKRWVIMLRGVEDASHAQLTLASMRARTALGLSCDAVVTVEEWLFDEATRGEFRKAKEAAA